MSFENLATLGELAVNPMIEVFLDILPNHEPTDFDVFEKAVAVLIKYDSQAQITVIKD